MEHDRKFLPFSTLYDKEVTCENVFMHKYLYKIVGPKPETVLYMVHTHNISTQEAETRECEVGS